MASYLFSLGNSSDGPIGFCARVTGTDQDAALATLKEHLEAINREVEAHKYADTDENIEYVTVYFNPDAITVADIEESETEDDEDDDLCGDCGRNMSEGQPHTADCEEALAQDLEDGDIRPGDDRYSDALEAFSSKRGHDFEAPEGFYDSTPDSRHETDAKGGETP